MNNIVPHNARRLTCFGETKSTGEWARDPRCQVDYEILNGRLKNKWAPEKAIMTPHLKTNFHKKTSNKNLPNIGDKFGRLKLLKIFYDIKYGNKNAWGEFLCECGNIKNILLSSVIKQKHTQSCGCLVGTRVQLGDENPFFKHGETKSKLYNIWANYKIKYKNDFCDDWHDYLNFKIWAEQNNYQEGLRLYRLDIMKQYCASNSIFMLPGHTRERLYHIWTGMLVRCYNPKFKQYCNYGGRGIIVCNEWKNNYFLFRKWSLENNYLSSKSIDRIDNNWHYCPENCRWATSIEQVESKHNDRLVLAFNELKTILHWSKDKRCIVPLKVFKKNLLNGLSPERAMQENL